MSLVIRPKGESQNGCFKKTNEAKFSKNISYPLIRTRMCAYQGVRNVCFSENLACFVFVKHPFWDSPFRLITDNVIPHFTALLDKQVHLKETIENSKVCHQKKNLKEHLISATGSDGFYFRDFQ